MGTEGRRNGYAECADAINEEILGGRSKKVKDFLGLRKKSDRLRDHLKRIHLTALSFAEAMADSAIETNGLRGNRQCKDACAVPRHSLQVQAEKAFMDRNFRNFLGHHHTIRCAINEHNPCKGLSGYVTTYQALGFDRSSRLNEREFATKRYILFLDEPDHIELGSPTHEAIKPLVERAAMVIFASGTFERGDGQRIAFLPYQEMPGGAVLNLASLTRPDLAVIEYNRRDALAEKAIIPLLFHLVDGRAEWIDGEGESRTTHSIAEAGEDTGDAIQFKQAMEIYQSLQTVNHTSSELSDMTPSEIEEKLRQAIESHNRRYERQNNMEHGTLNTQIMIQFGKSRNQMTLEELKRVWAWVQEKYPIKKLT